MHKAILTEYKHFITTGLVTAFILTQAALMNVYINEYRQEIVENEITVEDLGYELDMPQPLPVVEPEVTPVPTSTPTPTPKPKQTATQSYSDVDLIALVTMAEAEGESEEGKRLVIDTILNRVDSPRYPSTVNGVVYQKNQFEAMWNGRVNRCGVREDIRQLVIEEMNSRTNSEVLFFRTGHYSSYGTPLFKVGNHYFSK